MTRSELVAGLEALLRETYALWPSGWVGFNWRGYTYDHVQRVRGLALTLADREGGDRTAVELAALLHDITKPFDGEYLTDANGKRRVDDKGYWICPVRHPEGTNEVIELYDALELEGSLHSVSGAKVADALLERRGVDAITRQRVAETIVHHLKPPQDAPIESLCLYDADIIDANIGMPAFVRNIYINLHFFDRRKGPETPDLVELLARGPEGFLQPYVSENLPAWAKGKLRDFLPRLNTASAQEMAAERMRVLIGTVDDLVADLPDYRHNGHRQRLDVLWHYVAHRDDPSIYGETEALAQSWAQGETPDETAAFVERIRDEILGRL